MPTLLIQQIRLQWYKTVGVETTLCKGTSIPEQCVCRRQGSIFCHRWQRPKHDCLFAPEGCVINGVDSELYDWEEKLPRIEDLTDGMPTALQKLMTSHEVKKMKSTFCVWTKDGIAWHCNPMDGEDASRDLLSRIDGEAQTYVEYGKWFPADLPLEAVRRLADGAPVTKELVAALNPRRSEWEEIKAGLDKIGYPNEL